MKKNVLLKLLAVPSILILTLALVFAGHFSLRSKNEKVFAATNFTQQEITDPQNYFKMQLSVNPRKQTTILKDERTITNSIGEEITYHCFKWSEIENLLFHFSSDITESPLTFTAVKLVVTNIQSDDLTTPIAANAQKTLYQASITQNNFPRFDYYYYIDKTSTVKESLTTSKGNDFGLYKFDFIYTYLEDSKARDVSIGALNVAILPDRVEDIQRSDLTILYSPAKETRELVTIYNLKLSNDLYKYVNPKHIQWNVTGEDQSKIPYILTKTLKDKNPGVYASYTPIWQSLSETTGTSFVFDSNGIEGTWTVQCSITDSNGNEVRNLVLDGLSTIKKVKPSYLWLILVLVAAAVVIAGVVGLMVYKKRHDKVW